MDGARLSECQCRELVKNYAAGSEWLQSGNTSIN